MNSRFMLNTHLCVKENKMAAKVSSNHKFESADLRGTDKQGERSESF